MDGVLFSVAFLFGVTFPAAVSINNGLLPNGDFEQGPKPWYMKGSEVTNRHAIPYWEIFDFVEYIKFGQTQKDMILVVPEGKFALRPGNGASIKQKIKVTQGVTYSITFSAARTCAQEETLNLTVTSIGSKRLEFGFFSIQTLHDSNGWDSYSWAFEAMGSKVEFKIHNPRINEDVACGPMIDSIAIKALSTPKWSIFNMLKNRDFEEGPYVFPNTTSGVLIPPLIDDHNSPLPRWIVESLKVVKYIDSCHFAVPQGHHAIELVGGKESALAQIVRTIVGKLYALTFIVGDANNSCVGSMVIKAFAGKETLKVSYESQGKGGSKRAKLLFKATSIRTRVVFLSMSRNDNSGTLCGPIIDDVRLVGVRKYIK